jgi:hypothetical protein
MEVKELVTRSEIVVVETLCNKCGGKIDMTYGSKAHLLGDWGYGSNKDNETHSSDLCEPCYDGIVSTFAIPPTVL